MSDANFNQAFNLSATVFASTNSKPLFANGDDVYRKTDVDLAPADTALVDLKEYTILAYWCKMAEGADLTEAFLDYNGDEATSSDTPLDPVNNGPGNLTTPHFYTILDKKNNSNIYAVHQSDLLTKADIKVYYADQVGNL